MFLRDQQYMVILEAEGSLTKAAKRLGISQSALSRWLTGLEEEMGTQLVIRTKRALIFTPEGQIYLNGCREQLQVILDIRNKLDHLSSSEQPSQTILLGGTAIRGVKTFMNVFPKFYRQYPNIILQFTSDVNSGLKQRLLEGEITMALLASLENHLQGLEYLKFMDEELLLMIPPGHPLSYDCSNLLSKWSFPVIDFTKLKDTPLMANEAQTSYSAKVDEIYEKAGLSDHIIFRSNAIPILYGMVQNGVAAAIIPDSYFNPNDGISAYSLSPHFIIHHGIGMRKGYALSEAEEYLIHLIMNASKTSYYMHQYAEYYLAQRKQKMIAYEYDKF